MRIIGGKYRGKKLIPPDGERIRPTTDRMRETLFNMLEHGSGPGIRGSKILDLFAGTGALGIEALSRSAAHVTFIDNDPRSMKLIKQNTALIQKPENTTYLTTDSKKINKALGPFDIIFIDPPYNKAMIVPVLTNIHEQELLSQNGNIIIEYPSSENIEIPDYFSEIKSKKMGEASFSILEHSV
ncbi:MAG: 16S rRNA (guanine(966)-N(2))-methyltransferase RsmD [Kordiimonadaceae bacterium]|nr:16S rRNA (guanine(966)-N(2))-methyltransferase RsmD [Kordiimonadaceae bacterium]